MNQRPKCPSGVECAVAIGDRHSTGAKPPCLGRTHLADGSSATTSKPPRSRFNLHSRHHRGPPLHFTPTACTPYLHSRLHRQSASCTLVTPVSEQCCHDCRGAEGSGPRAETRGNLQLRLQRLPPTRIPLRPGPRSPSMQGIHAGALSAGEQVSRQAPCLVIL
jgi:hypothetical protein